MRRNNRTETILETLPTSELLRLHERAFGPLDPVGKKRILATASQHGWDRSFGTEVLAA